ncbi:Choline transporter-like domain-containing protein [Rozella allomycis CSF55]|uniref:Protein PNS1 n=1 Tax=Rozella allomycis (strain CSF55) TaxID=988480 RepID=A0A075AQV2_ROZAC|nr:Choline transporter-like domain-containing protein [Rozella allomycis CSF55]|eukprot:EPZ32583.1 Choline transporter-like domain-containing protein [Rozella allomycis CSF55]
MSYQQPQYGNAPYGQPQNWQQPYGQPQPNYSQPQYNPPYAPQDQKVPEDSKKHGSTSNVSGRPVYQDLWAALLYLFHFVVLIGLGGYCIHAFINHARFGDTSSSGGNSLPVPDHTLGISIASMLAVAIVFTSFYTYLMYRHAKKLIYFTFIMNIAFTVALGVLYIAQRVMNGAVVMFIIAGLQLIFFYFSRNRIPFAALVLESVVGVLKRYPAMLNVPIVVMIATVTLSVFIAFAMVGSMFAFENGGYSIIFFIFSLYWTQQVIANTGHVTLSGVYSTFYFMEGTGQAISNPTGSSAKRALTYSFGSICFGSLIVAIIQFLRELLRQSARDGSFFGAVMGCCLGYIESLIEYFNHYAYVQVAMYGKPFCAAAKDTWTMVKSRGVDAIINDNFVGTALSFGSLICGVLSAAVAGLVIATGITSDSDSVKIIVIFVVIGLFVGLVIFSTVTTVVNSGTATIFVCLAVDPNSLRRNNPELFAKFAEVYPEVNFA